MIIKKAHLYVTELYDQCLRPLCIAIDQSSSDTLVNQVQVQCIMIIMMIAK